MSEQNEACQRLLDSVAGCLAVAVIDLNTGMVMGVAHVVDYFSSSYLDALGAAAVDMFRGKNVRRIEELVGNQHGTEIKDSFEEIFITSARVCHFMKCLKEREVIIVMATTHETSQGMGWADLRLAVPEIQASLP